ncbi:MAG: PSD1 and planctomycete cytochrome C domain-containing protein [Gemmataceae bacterium]
MPPARWAALLVLLVSPPAALADPAGDDFFEKAVRPVLVERCLGCHAADKAKGGLRLDTRDGVLKGGDSGPAAVPGKLADSLLVKAIRYADDVRMPPKEKLPERERLALERWVEMGLPWPARAVLKAPDAIEKAAAAHWAFRPVTHPAGAGIDALVAAKWRDKGLSPAPLADHRTVIRRATFDLHGLPPTPEEVDAFEKDAAPDAYAKLIDRLLASPRYGERWGRHWLDVARYADNKGYVFFEGKEYPWAWTYRDWVIDALNRDLPYDRFVTAQLAADLAMPADRAALGFLTVGGHFVNNTHDIIDDRIDVVTRGLMGLTVTCARCHDHKFDPVPSADYYSLYGVFRSTSEPVVPPLLGVAPQTGEHTLYDAELKLRQAALDRFVTARHTELVTGGRTRAAEYLLAAHAARNHPPADDFMLIADRGDLNPAMTTRWRQFLADTKRRKDPAWQPWHALAELPDADFSRKAAEALSRLQGGNTLVKQAFATAPESMKDAAARYGKLLASVDSPTPNPDPDAEALRRVLHGPDSPADAPLALDWGFLSLFPDRGSQAEYQKLLRDVENWLLKGPPRAMALADAERPYQPRVFERGQPGRVGVEVPRQMPRVVNPQRRPFGPGSGRFDLAREIVSPTNPLTARVFVNRVWMHHFGVGLVATPGDFGLRGDAPSHPELLDWLAAEFVDGGWSMKRLHRLIMLSDTYRRSSVADAAADPENRWLARYTRRRLEFEPLHDALLAVSGSLDTKLGGPPVPRFGSHRRAVYGYTDRLEFPTLLTTFDVPNPAASIPERTATTVAPQALFLMNGPFARDAAKRLAARPDVQRLEPAPKVERLYRLAFGRPPAASEAELARAFVARGPERWADLAHALLLTNEFAFVD